MEIYKVRKKQQSLRQQKPRDYTSRLQNGGALNFTRFFWTTLYVHVSNYSTYVSELADQCLDAC